MPGITAVPHEDNLRYFDVTIHGPAQSPYEGENTCSRDRLDGVQRWLTSDRRYLSTRVIFTWRLPDDSSENPFPDQDLSPEYRSARSDLSGCVEEYVCDIDELEFWELPPLTLVQTIGLLLYRSAPFFFQSRLCSEPPIQTIPLRTMSRRGGRRTSQRQYKQQESGRGLTPWPSVQKDKVKPWGCLRCNQVVKESAHTQSTERGPGLRA